LGSDFLDEVEAVLAAITANPARYGYTDRDVREGLVKRFPYAVYYRVLPNRIRVLAVYHTARNPIGWKSRK
jgi:plasmid stabilization system protein ParE